MVWSAMLIGFGLAMIGIAIGCGGVEGGTADADSLTRAQFVRRANALCRKERIGLPKEAAKVMARERARGKSHDVALVETARHVLLRAIETEIARIWALGVPPADGPGIRSALSSEELTIDKLATADGISSMKEFHRQFTDSARQLRFNGLHACANDG